MKNIGESKIRNDDFEKSFSRDILIRNLIPQSKLNNSSFLPIIFDIGAHKGESIKYFREILPQSRIYSFEPNPDSFTELKKLENNHTFCHQFAMANSNEEAPFYRNKFSHTNSLLKVNLESNDSIFLANSRLTENDIQSDLFNQQILIKTVRLEDFCHEYSVNYIDILKIDVQGAEEKVLLGAGSMLSTVNNLIIEISLFDYYEHQSSFLEIEQIIEPFGFKLFSISEISNNPMNGRTDWVEAIYTR